MLPLLPLLLFGAGCSRSTPASPPVAQVGLALPDFTATAQDGTPRTAEDLRGHPTVLWFFPYAGTPG